MTARERRFGRVVSGGAAVALAALGLVILVMYPHSPALPDRDRLAAASGFGAAALALWCWRYAGGVIPAVPKRSRGVAAFLSSIFGGLGSVLLLRLAISTASRPCQVYTNGAWMMLPLALAGGLIFALEEAAYQNASKPAP